MLRSYDSRREPPPDYNCSIWQAGRATSAALLAFKPIQIGQNVYLDEGAGKYNPSPQIMDEAMINEWPGREMGVFVSIGTGKRPGGTSANQHEWWEGFLGGSMGEFAEARRRLMAKIEGCEDTHQYMLKEHLAKRGVPRENYVRLNVEVGVGEFGMNEWSRLADMNTSTRRYLAKPEVVSMNYEAAVKLGKIERMKRRLAGRDHMDHLDNYETPAPDYSEPSNPMAVELPGDEVPPQPDRLSKQWQQRGPQYPHDDQHPYYTRAAHDDKFAIISSDEYPQVVEQQHQPRRSGESLPYRPAERESFVQGDDSYLQNSPRRSGEGINRTSPPPLPPKTPLSSLQTPPSFPPQNHPQMPRPLRHNGHAKLPYPETDGPPPMIDISRKPEYINR